MTMTNMYLISLVILIPQVKHEQSINFISEYPKGHKSLWLCGKTQMEKSPCSE